MQQKVKGVYGMFQVGNTTLSDDVATTKFACDISKCKGACCVIGDSGAPVNEDEIPVLRKAFKELKKELRQRAREVVDEEGLITYDENGEAELNCTDDKECVFVVYDSHGVATCAIHNAYNEGRFPWMKPISCHLFPLRINTIGSRDYVNYQYISQLCSSACSRGIKEGIYLSDFLKEALVRKFGKLWYEEFTNVCKDIRSKVESDL